ncbi:unnamed protein product [Candida verbasci]|uniref:phosphoserine phosphatase n=1 Tax=Candida verbasci TaxID=1227364 RepID=A0A9W4XF62_9ASCO|nr:unnamed protein product [Candida verbasci]
MTMTQCVITVISKFENENIDYVEEYIKGISEFRKVVKSSRAIDYFVEVSDVETVRKSLKSKFLHTIDVIIQPIEYRSKKLFVFDMDSTLIYQEVIELIADSDPNLKLKIAEITERAMNGELDFNESLKKRVGLLKGINAETLWDDIKPKLKITNGAKELIQFLKSKGIITSVCSGGFIELAEYIKSELGLDYAYANKLGISDNKLNGEIIGEIVNGEKKAQLLKEIAKVHNIDTKFACAVGDGANDLPMMSIGFGIAWNAKPKVQLEAPSCLNTDSLKDIKYIIE